VDDHKRSGNDILKLPGYVCVACEKPFSRKWNIKRHIFTQHPNQPVQPVTLIDYLVGRQTGIYKKRAEPKMFDQNNEEIALFLNYLQLLNPKYAPVFRGGPLGSPTIKRAPKVDDILPYFRPQDEEKPRNDTLTQTFSREFLQEIARQLAIRSFSQLNQRTPPYIQQMMPQSYSLSNFLIPAGNRTDIFGFRTHICPNCLLLEHLAVSYPPEMLWKRGAVAGEIKHTCKPILIAYDPDLDDEVRSTSVLVMQEKSPSYLKDIVDLWTEKQVALVAIEVPSSHGSVTPLSRSHEPQSASDRISITNPRNPNTSISFLISREKKVQLNPSNRPDIPRHWSLRVMQNKQTTLSDTELQEFLNLVKNATFGIFNVYLCVDEDSDRINNNDNNKHGFLSNKREQQKYRDKQIPTVRSFFMYLTCKE